MLRRPLASSRLLPWLGLAVAAPAFAHHSIAGVYDSTRTTTVAGRVTEFRFVNPHPILVIDAAAEGEPPELWLLEMDNRFELTRIGIAADTYRAGDRVVARGAMARNEPQRLYLRRLERPSDKVVYEQVGSTPRFGVPPLPARRAPGPPGR